VGRSRASREGDTAPPPQPTGAAPASAWMQGGGIALAHRARLCLCGTPVPGDTRDTRGMRAPSAASSTTSGTSGLLRADFSSLNVSRPLLLDRRAGSSLSW
jgi:hypothetical protein